MDERERRDAQVQRKAQIDATAHALEADVEILRARAFRTAWAASVALVVALSWGVVDVALPALGAARLPVGVVLLVVAALAVLVALASACAPIRRRTGFDENFFQVAVWFPASAALGTPLIALVAGGAQHSFARSGDWVLAAMGVAGPIVVLLLGIRNLVATSTGGILVGGRYRPKEYRDTTLPRGEAKPLGMVFLMLAILYPTAVTLLVLPVMLGAGPQPARMRILV